MPRTEDRSADFIPADPHERDGIPRLRIYLYTYLSWFSSIRFKHNTWYVEPDTVLNIDTCFSAVRVSLKPF